MFKKRNLLFIALSIIFCLTLSSCEMLQNFIDNLPQASSDSTSVTNSSNTISSGTSSITDSSSSSITNSTSSGSSNADEPWKNYVNSYNPVGNNNSSIQYMGQTISTTVNNDDDFRKVIQACVFYGITSLPITANYTVSSNFGDSVVNKAINSVSYYYNLNRCPYQYRGSDYTFNFEYHSINPASKKAAETNAYTQVIPTIKHFTKNETTRHFAIDSIATNAVPVYNSEQLLNVVAEGYKPAPITGSVADYIYQEAKAILKDIISDDMRPEVKVHAIYDYLVNNICYDDALLDLYMSGSSNLKEYEGFFLEGALLTKRAVCDGISKAFVLLSRIEGIEAIQVSGHFKSNGAGHAWNKVNINDAWYVTDATGGNLHFSGSTQERLTHRYLLINDATFLTDYVQDTDVTYPSATVTYDIFSTMKYQVNDNEYNFVVSSQTELNRIIKYLVDNHVNYADMEIKTSFAKNSAELGTKLTAAVSSSGYIGSYGSSLSGNTDATLTVYFNNGVSV